jgi:hypothetical protein
MSPLTIDPATVTTPPTVTLTTPIQALMVDTPRRLWCDRLGRLLLPRIVHPVPGRTRGKPAEPRRRSQVGNALDATSEQADSPTHYPLTDAPNSGSFTL